MARADQQTQRQLHRRQAMAGKGLNMPRMSPLLRRAGLRGSMPPALRARLEELRRRRGDPISKHSVGQGGGLGSRDRVWLA